MQKYMLATVAAVLTMVSAMAADEKYDLRGPAPTKGQVTVTQMKMVIKEAETTVVVGGMKIAMTMTMNFQGNEEIEALEVDGRQITKSREKVVKDGVHVKAIVFGQSNEEDKAGELEGESVVGTRSKDGKWEYKLVDGKPDEEQERELKRRHGPENDDDIYPAEKVAVGHKWEVDAAKLKSLTGNSMKDVKGKMKQKFVKIEKVNGEECAVIETTGKLTAKMVPEKDDNDPSPEVEMDVTALGWKSLKTGLEVKATFEGKIKLSGKQKADGQEVEIEMEGPITGESTAKFKDTSKK
jgi:hypothetical protein